MKTITLLAAVLLAVGLSGCLPERIVWAPDGSRALVLANDRGYLTDAQGKLTEIAKGWKPPVAWAPDSRHVLIAGREEAESWLRYAEVLTPAERDFIVARADAFRAEIMAAKAEGMDLGPMKSVKDLPNEMVLAIKMYLYHANPEGLKEKLGDKWNEFRDAHPPIFLVRTADLSGGTAVAGPVVLRTAAGQIVDMHPAPSGKVLACTAAVITSKNSKVNTCRLLAVGIPGKADAPMTVAEGTGWYFDWSPDGRRLVYSSASRPEFLENVQLGAITSREICAENGTILAKLPGTKDIAAVVFDVFGRIQCLDDGRIVFASAGLSLPAAPLDMPQRQSLFMADPGRRATLARALPRSISDAFELSQFRVSPDGRRISLADGKGRVGVMDLATGNVAVIVSEQWHDLRVIPTWRSANEVCLVVPPGSPLGSKERAEIVLWSSPGKYRCISKTWPDDVIKGLLK